MDIKLFWLIGFLVIGLAGSMLTFSVRYKNPENYRHAGRTVVNWIIAFLFIWLLAGATSFF